MAAGPRPRRASAGAVVLLLGACGSTPQAPAPAPPPCPTALLLEGLERTTAYRPGAELRPSEISYLAVLTDLTSACRYGSGEEGGDMEVDLNFAVVAERGPAMSGTEELAYFVATMGPDGRILGKEVLQSELAFVEGENRIGWSEELTFRVPSVTSENGANYTLYIGFQLDDAELERRRQPLLRQ